MARNTPEQPLVAAIDPREALRTELDAQSVALSTRLRTLELTRKQLDLEISATEDAIRVASAGIDALSSALAQARELATLESIE